MTIYPKDQKRFFRQFLLRKAPYWQTKETIRVLVLFSAAFFFLLFTYHIKAILGLDWFSFEEVLKKLYGEPCKKNRFQVHFYIITRAFQKSQTYFQKPKVKTNKQVSQLKQTNKPKNFNQNPFQNSKHQGWVIYR